MNGLDLFAIFHTIFIKIYENDDVLTKIFEYYKPNYENYTLLELIYLVKNIGYNEHFEWNKKYIIKLINEKKLPIPDKYEPLEKSIFENKWIHYKKLDILYVNNSNFKTYSGDMYKMSNGKTYMLFTIITKFELTSSKKYDYVCYIYFLDNLMISAEKFFHILDTEDVTILKNQSSLIL